MSIAKGELTQSSQSRPFFVRLEPRTRTVTKPSTGRPSSDAELRAGTPRKPRTHACAAGVGSSRELPDHLGRSRAAGRDRFLEWTSERESGTIVPTMLPDSRNSRSFLVFITLAPDRCACVVHQYPREELAVHTGKASLMARVDGLQRKWERKVALSSLP